MALGRSLAGAIVSDERYTPFAGHRPQSPTLTLIETCWEMTSPQGRVLTCGVFQTTAGLEVRCRYSDDDLIRSQYA